MNNSVNPRVDIEVTDETQQEDPYSMDTSDMDETLENILDNQWEFTEDAIVLNNVENRRNEELGENLVRSGEGAVFMYRVRFVT